MDIIQTLAKEFSLKNFQVENTVKLFDEGNTIPFIARYRKEATGSLDDQLLRELTDRLKYLRNLDETRDKIISTITEQEKMTDELLAAIQSAATLTELEDLYRPYKPKRKTRASVAKEKGLEPLSLCILEQTLNEAQLEPFAADFLNDAVPTLADALQGAKDIIAEYISDDAAIRKGLRAVMTEYGLLVSTVSDTQKDETGVYKMYYEYKELVKRIPSHRILAVNRGEKEGILKVSVDFDTERAMTIVTRGYVKNDGFCAQLVMQAAADAYSRLIFPSVEREIRNNLTEQAEESAIQIFGTNLKQLLLQPPVKNHTVLGLDPGYRTGCKAAVVDRNGKVLQTGVIYPAPPHSKIEEAKKAIKQWIEAYGVSVISIGNGTASHETEVFVSELLQEIDEDVSYMVVSEAGASVYSASKLAATEFPDYDVSLRSAVSIARRLQDPLAELVKIDPKAIGVGQYQHDMPQARLSQTLEGVVEDAVNAVGVDLNTASAPLLEHVAGVNAAIAKNMITYREENGGFKSRTELKKVAKLGPKAFEQCAGFLRIPESRNLLDNTAVHPESYHVAEKLLQVLDTEPAKLTPEQLKSLPIAELAAKLDVGVPTLTDILAELAKPGRDLRDALPAPMLKKEILDMAHLKPGMELRGTVRNVIDFGAFVDIGVHQDGLVHISQITNRYIRHPSEVLKVGDIVTVWVLSVDTKSKRIGLTMKPPALQ